MTPTKKDTTSMARKTSAAKAANMNPTADDGSPRVIELPPLLMIHVEVDLVGQTPLVLNPMTPKALQMILDRQNGKKGSSGEEKTADIEMEKRLVRLDGGGFGFPLMAFKKAMVSASSTIKGMKGTNVKQGVFMTPATLDENGQSLARIFCEGVPEPMQAHTRNATGVADVRIRPILRKWHTTLVLTISAHAISLESALNCLRLAGRGVGVGDWRPEKNGDYGRFAIDTVRMSTSKE